MTASIELAIRENINHFNNKKWFVVQDLDSGEELIDVDSREEAECRMLKLIEENPEKYFTNQDVCIGFAYRITSSGYGSARYGACEVCGKHADTTYIFTKYVRRYSSSKKAEVLCHKGNAFGHKNCLSLLTKKTTL